jgi:hypothetical protein
MKKIVIIKWNKLDDINLKEYKRQRGRNLNFLDIIG